MSLRCHFDFISMSLQFHFDITSFSLWLHFDSPPGRPVGTPWVVIERLSKSQEQTDPKCRPVPPAKESWSKWCSKFFENFMILESFFWDRFLWKVRPRVTKSVPKWGPKPPPGYVNLKLSPNCKSNKNHCIYYVLKTSRRRIPVQCAVPITSIFVVGPGPWAWRSGHN